MASSWTLLTASIQLIAIIAAFLQRSRIVDETNKARLSEALARVAVAVDAADEVRHAMMALSDEDLDKELME